ncbi:right-handed parallel beta-helix repeat-containing protein [Vineibacter terrae]|uniref:right-handed parallel beta-helix repeat-containing protein n=1 Tax=Vineibacter terrae TaxID=2586908 RepID=UPI002E362A7F|nr:glycosyl hydrolase family 28-related protein [Vineibacter terrae]HEX2890281.1 glycosyl hydrolase family 28-related protein [Vineibacter terrae]
MNALDAGRRRLLGIGAGMALAAAPLSATAQPAPRPEPAARRTMLSAASFGAVGDGKADDTRALQAALDATFAPGGPGFLVIPPGEYKVSRTLRIATRGGPPGDIGRHSGITAHGAHIVSAITNGANVFEFVSGTTVRFILIEGLDVLGSGSDGHGIYLECEHKEHYLYNICLRDVAVQDCGGDGCRMVGNVFEGQVINSYFRKNNGNGITFGHGFRAGILSAIHVFGCVFGDNGRHGAALVNRCYDVGFHGCYFLLNGKFGLVAENGCTILSNCGFENNHQAASGFETGDAGIALQGFATLIGCGAYSIYNQTHLIRAYVVGQLVMIGCGGFGDERAKGAGFAKIGGRSKVGATIIGCTGTIEYVDGFDGVEMGGAVGGLRLASDWRSPNLARLGDYRLWVDKRGNLRLKKGAPSSDEDGTAVGRGAG